MVVLDDDYATYFLIFPLWYHLLGPSPLKSLRSALVAGDEEKALTIYTTKEKGGKSSLEEDLHPSMPFPLKKHQSDTPLHLAAEAALGKLVCQVARS